MSFKSDKPFNDFQHFARGIRRSGEFSIRESNILETHGCAMMDLYNGTIKPKDAAEKTFVEQLKSTDIITDDYARIFKKYLTVIQPRRLHRLCANGTEDEISNSGGYEGGSDDSM